MSATDEPKPSRPGAPGLDFDLLYAEQRDSLYRTLRAITGEPAVAEELVQEAFIRAYRSRHRYDPAWKPGVWLHAIGVNLARSHLRRARLLRFLPLAGSEPAPPPDVRDSDLLAALAQIKPADRAAVVLSFVHGYTYEEIGRIVGAPAGTVASRINRARNQLRTLLAPEARSGWALRGDAEHA